MPRFHCVHSCPMRNIKSAYNNHARYELSNDNDALLLFVVVVFEIRQYRECFRQQSELHHGIGEFGWNVDTGRVEIVGRLVIVLGLFEPSELFSAMKFQQRASSSTCSLSCCCCCCSSFNMTSLWSCAISQAESPAATTRHNLVCTIVPQCDRNRRPFWLD